MKTKFSLEIIPKQVEKIKDIPKDLVDDVYVTYIPGSSPNDVINASETILNYGFNPVPHCPARTIPDEEILINYIDGLVKKGVKKILIIGGSVSTPKGKFSSSIDLLNTGLFQQSKIKSVNIAGHPEGNPDDENHFENMINKSKWLGENNFQTNIITQWCLSPDITNSWISKTKSQIEKIGVKSEIHLGIAGPAKLTTILKYAKICGVSATTSVFMKQGLDIRKIINHNPDNILKKLTGYDKLHIYPFGGINEFFKWYKNSNFQLSEVF